MNSVIIAGKEATIRDFYLITVDEFVPLRFRTYDKLIGAAYVRIGNLATTLAELIVEPNSQVLRGITLTSFETLAAWPVVGEANQEEGLPILMVDWGNKLRCDVKRDFFVSVRDHELLIAWESIEQLTTKMRFGNAEFLISENKLNGVRFFDLTEKEISLLLPNAARRQ